MYELIDARDYGHEVERPLLIVERWGKQLRRIYAFRPCDADYAGQIVERMNSLGSTEDLLANAS